jgi:hypothetical protein
MHLKIVPTEAKSGLNESLVQIDSNIESDMLSRYTTCIDRSFSS